MSETLGRYPQRWLFASLLFLFVLTPRALGKPDPYAAYVAFLTKTLHVAPAVTQCAVAIDKKVAASSVFAIIFHLDNHLLNAKIVRSHTVFSAAQPAPVDKVVVLKGTARLRGMQDWMKVRTRCGLLSGHVVAISIDSRELAGPRVKQISD